MSQLFSVNKINENQYIVSFNVGINIKKGKRQEIKKVFNTLEEAEEFKRVVENEVKLIYQDVEEYTEEGLVAVTLREFVNDWFLKDYQLLVRPKTFRTRRYVIEKQIIPFLGDKLIADITVDDIKLLLHQYVQRFSGLTVSKITENLSIIFHEALNRGLVKTNPMAYIRKDWSKKERNFIMWNNEEITRFLTCAEKEKNDMIYSFSLFTGTRMDELLALTWDDIDFEKKSVTISKQLYGNGRLGTVEILKSGHHELPLPSKLIEKLKVHKQKQEANKGEMLEYDRDNLNLVFTNREGRFLSRNRVRSRLNKLIQEAAVPKIHFRDFRRMYAIMLAKNGVSLFSIKVLLRHKSINTTFSLLESHLLLKDDNAFGKIQLENHKVMNLGEKEADKD